MNLKIALAAAVLLTGGTYACDAQQKNAVSKSAATTSNAFANKIKEYQHANDSQSAVLLAELKQMMRAELGTAKAEIAAADQATGEKLMQKFETRRKAMNEVTRLADSGDKKSITAALQKFDKAE